MGASSVPRLRLQEGQTAKPPGAVRKRTSQRPCGHPWLPVRARRRREEEGRQKKESRKRRQRFSDPPGEAPGRPPPTRGVPIAGTCYRKARSFAGVSFRFEVTLSPSPSRSSSHLGGSHGVSSGVHTRTVLAGSCRARDRSLVVSSWGCVVGSLPLTDLGPRISFSSITTGGPHRAKIPFSAKKTSSHAKKSIICIISMYGARSLGRQGFSTTNAFPTTRYPFPRYSRVGPAEPLSPEI